MGSFVENVNKLASDLNNDLVNDITNVACIAGDITKLVDIHDSGELPLINDVTPSNIDVFSSAKVQAMHNAQAEAIANLSSITTSSSIKLKNANGKTLSVTNSNANQTDKEVIYLNTVDELANASGSINAVAIVSDLNRGGTFEWSATGTANGGTVFAGVSGYWNRQYSGAVNIK